MHILHAAEPSFESGRENNDGDFRPTTAQLGGDFGAELSGAEMIVKNRNIYPVKQVDSFFDSAGGFGDVAVFAQDGGA